MMRTGQANFRVPFNAPEIRQLRHEHANRAAEVPMRMLKRHAGISMVKKPKNQLTVEPLKHDEATRKFARYLPFWA